MTLRVRLLIAFGLLCFVSVGASLFAAERYLAAGVREGLVRELNQASQAFVLLHAEQSARRAAESRVVAEEPRLKAVVRTTEIDQATLEDVADELRAAARAQVFALIDRAGQVEADVSDQPLPRDLSAHDGVKQALASGEGLAVWAHHGGLHQMVIRPLRFGAEVTGLLLTGYLIADAEAKAAQSQSGADVLVLLGGKVLGSAIRPDLKAHAAQFAVSSMGISELVVEGERFVALKAAYPGAQGVDAAIVFVRSFDEVASAHHDVRFALFGIGGAALVLALFFSTVLSRGLSKGVESLSAATAALAAGNLSARAAVRGEDEIAQLSKSFNGMADELERSREVLIQKKRLEREMEIAQRIQTMLLPDATQVPGFRVAATMRPAEDVGGDFYDVRVGEDGSIWFAIGDVTSHGLTPGLIMMMAQSALGALIAHDPAMSPRRAAADLNRIVYSNVKERLRTDDHLTFVVLRSEGGGLLRFSGAHLPLLIRRLATGALERVQTPGVWIGVVPEIAELLTEQTLQLEVGDELILYSDGVTEARDAAKKLFDLSGLEAAVKSAGSGAEAVKQAVLVALERGEFKQDDDITLVVVERTA